MGISRNRFIRKQENADQTYARGSHNSISSVQIINPQPYSPASQDSYTSHVAGNRTSQQQTDQMNSTMVDAISSDRVSVDETALSLFEDPVESTDINYLYPDFSSDPERSENVPSAKTKKARRPIVQIALRAGIIVGLFGASVGAGAYSTYLHSTTSADKASSDTSQKQNAQNVAANGSGVLGVSISPGSSTILQQTTNSGQRLSPSDPYYQYSDSFMGGAVTISRQPLPDQYKTDPRALQKFASQINAKESFQTEKWGTAYMFTDSKSTVQVLVFKNSSKLVIVQSNKQHSAAEWTSYIDGLSV